MKLMVEYLREAKAFEEGYKTFEQMVVSLDAWFVPESAKDHADKFWAAFGCWYGFGLN